MKISALSVMLFGAPSAVSGFVPTPSVRASPRSFHVSRGTSATMTALPAMDAAISTLQTSTTLIAAAAEPGTVNAPGWVLPLGAGLVILTAGAIPLLLKPGDDAAKDMQERDADIWEQNQK